MSERMFPLMPQRGAAPGPLSIPWSVAEKAYSVYAAEFGLGQSLERLAERGGFGLGEMDKFYPAWRDEVSEIVKLKNALRSERRETASKVRDIARRIGSAAWPDYVRDQLDKLAAELEFWAK